MEGVIRGGELLPDAKYLGCLRRVMERVNYKDYELGVAKYIWFMDLLNNDDSLLVQGKIYKP